MATQPRPLRESSRGLATTSYESWSPGRLTSYDVRGPSDEALPGDDPAEHQHHAQGLGPAEQLAGEQHAEHGADHRVEQADQETAPAGIRTRPRNQQ